MLYNCVADWRWTGKEGIAEEPTERLLEGAAQEKKKHYQRYESLDLAGVGEAEENQEA